LQRQTRQTVFLHSFPATSGVQTASAANILVPRTRSSHEIQVIRAGDETQLGICAAAAAPYRLSNHVMPAAEFTIIV
jgi:hypothetical protein